MTRKSISDSVKKKLFTLSGNQCSFPRCTERVYSLDDGVLLGEMCHINAVNPSGARYDSDLSGEQINSSDNIILLCPSHHTVIDKNEVKYDASVLRIMKEKHEKKFYNYASKFEELIVQIEGDIDVSRLEELEAIDASLKSEVKDPILPRKKEYSPTIDYITRYVTSVRGGSEFNFESKTLLDTIKEEKRITVLGVAGSGKSIELANMAFVHSQIESNLYPVKIRLNTLTNQNIEDILVLEYPAFKSIPHDRLLILLDALDEVHADYLDIAVSNISLFSKKYENAKIIISCRNNFYITETDKRRAKLEAFSTYLIKPLDYYSIRTYLERKIDLDPDIFIEDLRRKKFYDLLYSPFYLVNLVDYYNSKKEIPESKKTVFDYLVAQRIESDYEKYENSGVSIQDYSVVIERFIEQLAVIAESLGKNYLDERTEVLPLINDQHLLKILKRTFLFNKSPQQTQWEFEHNNFQEFLAARYLSSKTFEEIQEFVSFQPDYKKIKPSWLNTLSFLFSLVEVKSEKYAKLINWVRDIESDILVRFEKDKIDLKIREQLFKEIYEEYESKEIIIRNEKFESEDLATFVSDSHVIIEYLIVKIVNTDEWLIISEALRMLPYFNSISDYKDKIREVLKSKLSRVDLSDKIKYSCLYALSELKISDKELTEEILKFNNLESGQYIRAGFYKYLENCDHFEDYIEILLKGLELIQKPSIIVHGQSKQTEPRLSDEKYNLELLFDKIKSSKNILRIIDWSATHDEHSHFDDIYFEQVKVALKKAAIAYLTGSKELYKSVLNLLLSFARRYYRELGVDFQEFFKETQTEFRAFKELFKNYQKKEKESIRDFDYAMALVCNEEGVKFLIDEIRNGRLVDPETWRIRNLLAWEGKREIHDLYHKELVKIDKEKYSYKKTDHEALKKARRKRDIELLFAKDEFLKEAKEIFNEESNGKSRITIDELYNWKKKRFNDEEMSNQIIVDTLRDKAKEKRYVDLLEVEELVVDENRWKWFILHKLIGFDKNNSDFEYSTELKNFIQAWVKEEIVTANFKTAIKFTDDGVYHYRYTELYISYFTQRLNIELSKENYLDFLYVDCYFLPVKHVLQQNQNDSKSPNTVDFLITKLDKEKVIQQILANLEEQKLVPVVKKRHFKYCQDLKMAKAAPIIFSDILTPKNDNFDRRELITQYVELKGDLSKLLKILNNLSSEVRLHAANLLAENKYEAIIEYSKNQIDVEVVEETRLRYIQIVAKVDEKEAFSLLKSWILKNKQLPERTSDLNGIGGERLNDLVEIFEDSLINNYGTDAWTSRNNYLTTIIELGSENDKDYFAVKKKLNYWLGKYDDMKYLHYQLQKLEQLYFSKKLQAITLEEVLELLNLNK